MARGFSNASFPLGVAYVAAAIRRKWPDAEIKVASFDIDGVQSREEIHQELQKISLTFQPDFIMFGGMITRYHYIVTLSRECRAFFPKAVQILGGGAATWGHELFFDEAPIDYFAVGQSEESILMILSGQPESNPGIVSATARNPGVKQSISNLDLIPIPSHADFRVQDYLNIQKRVTGWKTMPIVASRGCPFLCHFCTPSTSSLRIRSTDSVIEEFRFLKMQYGADSIYFWDELQFVKKPWFEELCQKLIKANLGMKWTMVTRATLVRDEDMPLLRLARQAGCARISIGIESGSEKVLKAMNKNTTVQQMADALRRVRMAGIKATGSMLLGFPGENQETVQQSVDFANRNLLETSFYNLIPLPGAEVYEGHCKKHNLIPDEKSYMYKVSTTSGDASNIILNLTEMDDAAYIAATRHANSSVRKFGMRDAIRYYGLSRGLRHAMISTVNRAKRNMTGRMFDTP